MMAPRKRVAVVTGGSRGIGAAVARALAGRGCAVVIGYAAASDAAAGVVKGIEAAGGRALALRADVANPEDARRLASAAAEAFGPPDILVNNAGVISRDPFEGHDLEAFRRILRVNLEGTVNCTMAVVPAMRERGWGRIVNVSSIAGRIGDLTAAPSYGASKGAVSAFTKSAARALAPHGITVNAVAPHAIATDMSAQWSEERRRAIVASIPVGRLGTPEEVAAAVAFLASEEAGFITGQVLHVNGGFLMEG